MLKSIVTERFYRYLMLFTASAMLPGFVMRCDKAALNFQRGFFEGLGIGVSEFLLQMVNTT